MMDLPILKTGFETHHNLNAGHLAKMYGFDYLHAGDAKELEDALNGFYSKSGKPMILEVHTPHLLNDKILLGYFDFIS